MTLISYWGGHKVPLAEGGNLVLAVYLESAVRALYPNAQQEADRVLDDFWQAFGQHIPLWLANTRLMSPGFRPPKLSPAWLAYWERVNPMTTPLAKAVRKPYVDRWLLGHPDMDFVVGFGLLISTFGNLGLLNSRAIGRVKGLLRAAVGQVTGVPLALVTQLLTGKHAAYALLSERVGPFNLVQERRLLHGALIFAARFCSDAPKPRSWDAAIQFLENERGELLQVIGASESFSRPSEAIRSAQPFTLAFNQRSEPPSLS